MWRGRSSTRAHRSTEYVQDTEVRDRASATGTRLKIGDVPINSNPLAKIKSFFQMHSHVKQGSDESSGAGGDKKLRIQAEPIPLEQGPQSGPNMFLPILRGEQIAEMNSASKTPVRALTATSRCLRHERLCHC